MRFPLVGNDRVKSAVENMLVSEKIPHAILIEGESGLGKTTLARFLCRAVLCEGDDPPCGGCRGCRLTESDNHPDLDSVVPQKGRKSISVDQVREIIAAASVVPQTAKRRVFLIDDADLLTAQAQNAILKILEEPPETVVFILTCVSRAAMLQTVTSRCAVLTLCPVDKKTATDYIADVSKRDAADISAAYDGSHGSIGAALNMLKHKSAGAAEAAAKEFMEILRHGSQYDLLKLLYPLEKDRAKTADFYGALEVLLVSIIRNCSSATLVRRYERLYKTVLDHKELLRSNTNLSLLLTALAATATTER